MADHPPLTLTLSLKGRGDTVGRAAIPSVRRLRVFASPFGGEAGPANAGPGEGWR